MESGRKGGGVVTGVGWLLKLLEILGRQIEISRGSVSGGVALPAFEVCDGEDVVYTAGVCPASVRSLVSMERGAVSPIVGVGHEAGWFHCVGCRWVGCGEEGRRAGAGSEGWGRPPCCLWCPDC